MMVIGYDIRNGNEEPAGATGTIWSLYITLDCNSAWGLESYMLIISRPTLIE